MCGDGKQAYRDISDKVYQIKSGELQNIERMICPKFESEFLELAIDISIREEYRKTEILDYLEEWVNSDDNLTLFKWELREVLRTLRQGKVEE